MSDFLSFVIVCFNEWRFNLLEPVTFLEEKKLTHELVIDRLAKLL